MTRRDKNVQPTFIYCCGFYNSTYINKYKYLCNIAGVADTLCNNKCIIVSLLRTVLAYNVSMGIIFHRKINDDPSSVFTVIYCVLFRNELYLKPKVTFQCKSILFSECR